MKKKLIYIVDDEKDIRDLVLINLKKNEFDAKSFFDGKALFKALKNKIPDLIILDIMLPGMDGIEIIKFLKTHKEYENIPIIMLTAKTDETDKVIGLEMGADDYVSKPFSPKELIARTRAILRRYLKEKKLKKENTGIIRYKNITIDEEKIQVNVNNKSIDLTATEFKLLKILINNKGKVCSREKLLMDLWGEEKTVIDRTIDVHIKHLRDKLGPAGKLIKNLRSFGYKIDEK